MQLVSDSAKGPFEIFWCIDEQCYWLFYYNVQINLKPIKVYSQVMLSIEYLEKTRGM